MLEDVSKSALGFLEAHWLEAFLGSDHYGYILDLKAKVKAEREASHPALSKLP